MSRQFLSACSFTRPHSAINSLSFLRRNNPLQLVSPFSTVMASNFTAGDRVARTQKAPLSTSNKSPVARGGRRRQARKHPYRLGDTATFASAAEPSSTQALQGAPAAPDAPSSTTGLSRFDDLEKYNIDPTLLKTISEDLKFEHMTAVQAATLPLLLSGSDVLAQAKTGTGKTVAFLLPVIQKLVTNKSGAKRLPCLLVISPTRELALQIAADAKQLLQRFPQYNVCTAIGGTNQRTEMARITSGCDILVATPGRLLDHLSQEDGVVRRMMQSLQSLVLDECDRLLDMGFLRDLRKIIGLLGDKKNSKRQGMLFSATIAPHVTEFASLILSDGYKFISTITKGESQTHDRVPQLVTVVPNFPDVAAGAVGAIRQELGRVGKDSFKAIVFAPTAALVDFYTDVLCSFRDLPPTSSLHSRMGQGKRTRVTNDFRSATNGILVATDVVARGMDFPGVSNVFQIGLPLDRESYIHRLGRTGRAGADGRGSLVLTRHEAFFPQKTLKGIKVDEVPADLSASPEVSAFTKSMDPEMQRKVYQAWLAYYKDARKNMGWSVSELVRYANDFAITGLGSSGVPILGKQTVGKMGLKGVAGLNVV